MRFALAAMLALASCGGDVAYAHDVQADGSAVPNWIKAECCSQAHAHQISEKRVHTLADGWHIDGFDEVIPYGKEQPSEDGTYWLFYQANADGTHSHPYCWIVPPKAF